jgi:toxin YoeB
MSYKVKMVPLVEKAVARWKKSNPFFHKKFMKVILELIEHPRTGTGHPEPLIGGNDVRWSRRLSAHDRIIYDIYDDIVTVLVIQVGGHYDDK